MKNKLRVLTVCGTRAASSAATADILSKMLAKLGVEGEIHRVEATNMDNWIKTHGDPDIIVCGSAPIIFRKYGGRISVIPNTPIITRRYDEAERLLSETLKNKGWL